MKISFVEPGDTELAKATAGAIALPIAEGRDAGPGFAALDAASGGAIGRAMADSRFTGKAEQILAVLAPAGLGMRRAVLAGLGKRGEARESQFEALGGSLRAHLDGCGETEAVVDLAGAGKIAVTPAAAAAAIAFGALLRGYRFHKYRTRLKPEQKPSLGKLIICVEGAAAARRAFAAREKLAAAVFATRDLVSEPPNVLFPESFADHCRELEKFGVEVEVLDEKKLKKLGAGALLGTGQGSLRPPRLVIMQWRGAKDREARPLAFVGKGITFDSGGISLKPGAGMEEMKWDMAGAGAVAGLMQGLATRKARVNAVGIVALAENMPDGGAQRPSDIVTSLSGQTIEVINTDAEGRLVLADALWYVQSKFQPRLIVDLATLTGAIIVALGHQHAGLFATDDELARRLEAAGKAVGETVWRMPLDEAFDREIDSEAADMRNVSQSRDGGSIIGAIFLKRFVENVPWAHLDIAGVAWSKKDKATVPKGATGFGVRLLDRLIADHYEA